VGLPDDVIDAARARPIGVTVAVPQLAAYCVPPANDDRHRRCRRLGDTEATPVSPSRTSWPERRRSCSADGRLVSCQWRLTAEGRATTLGRDSWP
jgi:hypothetical protein